MLTPVAVFPARERSIPEAAPDFFHLRPNAAKIAPRVIFRCRKAPVFAVAAGVVAVVTIVGLIRGAFVMIGITIGAGTHILLIGCSGGDSVACIFRSGNRRRPVSV